MRTLLTVTVSPRKAGAERLIADIEQAVSSDFNFKLGLVRSLHRRPVDYTSLMAFGLWGCLFEPAQIIHTHLWLSGLTIRIRKIWDPNFKWIHTIHSQYHNLRFSFFRQWIDRTWIFPKVDALVAVSPSVYPIIEKFSQAQLISNGISLTKRKSEARPSLFTIGTVAMLRREKGLFDLLDSAAQLRKEKQEFIWKIAGSGPLRAKLEKEIRRRGLDQHVQLLGFVERMDDFYADLNVYAQPSHQEPFGLGAMAALQFGLPIVAARVDNLIPMLRDGDWGMLVARTKDFSVDFARAICSIRAAPEFWRDKSYVALEHWQKHASLEQMTKGYHTLYRKYADLIPPKKINTKAVLHFPSVP